MDSQPWQNPNQPKNKAIYIILALLVLIVGIFYFYRILQKPKEQEPKVKSAETQNQNQEQEKPASFSFADYDKKLLEIANIQIASSSATSVLQSLWPVKTAYPNPGALLPFNRIVAYYGNLYSKGMGILGEYPEEVVLEKLKIEVKKWQEADPNTPVVPALHYIAVVAQGGPGHDGKYRARMPDKEIDKVLEMAKKINAIVFLDIQVGLSSVQIEAPLLEKYLKLSSVHLGIDPEFAMHGGAKPGTKIGSLDAMDINFAAEYLAKIVKENNLPPKILVVHRFTKPMLTNSKNIAPLPEVQIVVNMDGFGAGGNKINTYRQYVAKEPVEFTGFKLFYKNDSVKGNTLLSPERLLKLSPIPLYIQYQ